MSQFKSMNTLDFINMLAEICFSAQSHTFGWEDDDPNNNYELTFQCTAYTVACLIANRVGEGVDSCCPHELGPNGCVNGERGSVLEDLCLRDFELQTIDWWRVRMRSIVYYYECDEETQYISCQKWAQNLNRWYSMGTDLAEVQKVALADPILKKELYENTFSDTAPRERMAEAIENYRRSQMVEVRLSAKVETTIDVMVTHEELERLKAGNFDDFTADLYWHKGEGDKEDAGGDYSFSLVSVDRKDVETT